MIAIAAISRNNVLGHQNKIPWNLPEDLAWFKKTTLDQILIMGRLTYLSIGHPLPKRTTYVLSKSNFEAPGIEVISNIGQIKNPDKKKIFLCGGAQIYSQYLSECESMFLTHVKQTVEGDAFFPKYHNFILVGQIVNTPEFTINEYRRKTWM
jgi:dihydrofolate reductase